MRSVLRGLADSRALSGCGGSGNAPRGSRRARLRGRSRGPGVRERVAGAELARVLRPCLDRRRTGGGEVRLRAASGEWGRVASACLPEEEALVPKGAGGRSGSPGSSVGRTPEVWARQLRSSSRSSLARSLTREAGTSGG